MFPRELIEVSLHLRYGILYVGVVGLRHGCKVAFEARDVCIQLDPPDSPELFISVDDTLHHGSSPANGQLELHDLLQVSVGWLWLLSFVSSHFDQLFLVLKIAQGSSNDLAATV